MGLEEREKEILDILSQLAKYDAILIGGYAINAYTPPRFSIDCDLAVGEASEIKSFLVKNGFEEVQSGKVETPYGGRFLRFEKGMASYDILVGGVFDRMSGTYFSYDFIAQNSHERTTVGRATPQKIKIKIADPELLFIMKFVSCRKQDIRDIFMLSNLKLNADFITKTIKESYKQSLANGKKVKDFVNNPGFEDALQGVYGALPANLFETLKQNLFKVLDRL
ncbi:MAG TPA: nucleotidyl transferase AbiEii/AbiGii toxin family protein [archaeon]|nr:nucleotidyl transferase AbiEii/AbiGii toxin family protein [archaeon]